jgi:type IV pilus assembly protein PilC
MPCFKVIQRSEKHPNREPRTKIIEASSDILARAEAESMKGWVTTQVIPITGTPFNRTVAKVKFIKGRPLIEFCQTMASMLRAGIVPIDALGFYKEGLDDPVTLKTITGIVKRLRAGEQVPSAFEKSGRFDDVFIGLVKAGYQTGQLDKALDAIASRTRTTMQFSAKLQKATLVPAICIGVSFLSFVLTEIFFIPIVEKQVNETGQQPDPFSAIVFWLSHALRSFWWVLVVLGVGVAFVWGVKSMRERILQILMKRFRVLHNMIMGFRQLLFVSSMDMLTNNGIDVLGALETTLRVVRGMAMEGEFKAAYERHKKGTPLAEALDNFTSCDRRISHLVRIGESSGTVETQFTFLRRLYEELTDSAMDKFAAISKFWMTTIALALIVFQFISVYWPILSAGLASIKSAL